MTLPEFTRWLLWTVFWVVMSYDIVVISMERYDATVSNVLCQWNRSSDGFVAAILLGLWCHCFWRIP
jgi:hypothetical protein